MSDKKHMIIKRNGFPVMLADTAVLEKPADEEEVKINGVKVTEGGSLMEKLAPPTQKILDTSVAKDETGKLSVTAVRLIPNGNEVDIEVDRIDQAGEPYPLSITGMPTTDSDKELIEEVAYKLRPPRSGMPEGADPRRWEIRQDAVRDAAREFDSMEEGDARDFLDGRVEDPSAVDYATFIRDVQEHRLDDLADILDYDLRQKVEGMRRSRRWVRLQAPKGWTQRVINKLGVDDLLTLCQRLERRGFNSENITSNVIEKIKSEDTKEALLKRYTSE